MIEPVITFMSGAIALGFLLCGVGFLRLWSRSRDPFFLAFAGAFWLLALPPFSVFWQAPDEDKAWVYLARIGAYLLIIVAIVAKNRGAARFIAFHRRSRLQE